MSMHRAYGVHAVAECKAFVLWMWDKVFNLKSEFCCYPAKLLQDDDAPVIESGSSDLLTLEPVLAMVAVALD